MKITTLRQFEKTFDYFIHEVEQRELFVDNSEKAKQTRKDKSKKDIMFFANTYFPEYFRDKSPSFQKEWEKIREITNEPILVMASRGLGKSTFFTFLDIIYRIVFSKDKFIIIGSYVENKAVIFTTRILIELLYNQKLINDFGEIIYNSLFYKTKKSFKHFTAISPITKDRIDIKAFSIGQDPRGIINGAYRPTCVRLDDIQSSKRAKSKKFVIESINWIFESLLPALENNYSLVILATPLNNKCVASTLKNGDEAKNIKKIKTYEYPVLDKKGNSIWIERFPIARLEKLKQVMPQDIFNQEFLLRPRKIDDRIFDRDLFKMFSLKEMGQEVMKAMAVVGGCDFSMTANGDYKATIIIGFYNGKIYVLKTRIRKERTDIHIRGIYQLYRDGVLWTERIFYEDVTANKENISALRESFEYIAKEKGYPLPLEPVRNISNKIIRISSNLSTLINNGEILFNIDDPEQKILIEQLEDFPDGDNDDAPDALSIAVSKGIEWMKMKNFSMQSPVFIPKKDSMNWSGY